MRLDRRRSDKDDELATMSLDGHGHVAERVDEDHTVAGVPEAPRHFDRAQATVGRRRRRGSRSPAGRGPARRADELPPGRSSSHRTSSLGVDDRFALVGDETHVDGLVLGRQERRVGEHAHLGQVEPCELVGLLGRMPPLVTAFWILKKAKAMPNITMTMVSAPMAWAPSWPQPVPP